MNYDNEIAGLGRTLEDDQEALIKVMKRLIDYQQKVAIAQRAFEDGLEIYAHHLHSYNQARANKRKNQ